MHHKIKGIRVRLGLSETQVSSILNISCYKYKRFEDNTMPVDGETLYIISLMYNIPADYFVYDKYSLDMILQLDAVAELTILDTDSVLHALEMNLCTCCSFQCSAVSYRVVKNILARVKRTFGKNLYKMRTGSLIEITDIAASTGIQEEQYLRFEQGKALPQPAQLMALAEFFHIPIQDGLLP